MHYLETLRAAFPKKHDVDLELMCASDPVLQKLTGHDEHHHRVQYMRHLFPRRVHHEWRDRLFRAFERCKREGRKELMILGSSNSNKTGGMADLAHGVWLESPSNTSVYVASPYEDATETGIWARIQEQFETYKNAYPHLPGKLKPSQNMIVQYDRNPLSFIKVVTIDAVGKMVGKKASDFLSGFMLILFDELPELRRGGEELIAVMANLISVPNVLLVGSGNFADPNDALGRMAEPEDEAGYMGLDEDNSQEWITKRGGLCIRFDGHDSPNIKAGKDLYPFLTTRAYLDQLAKVEGGTRSPGYMRFGRSFPVLGLNEFTVTNEMKVKAGGGFTAVDSWTTADQHFGAHCDPGFGGDPCIYQPYRVGRAMVDGREVDVFEPTEDPIVIPITIPKLREGEASVQETIDTQIAEACKKLNQERGITQDWFSFDDSLRGGIVQAMMRVIGMRVVAISSGGPATKRRLSAIRQRKDASQTLPEKQELKTARDEYANFNTEMHFQFASAIDGGQIRSLQRARESVRQLSSRKWRWSGKKKEIEPKFSSEEGAKARGWGYKQRIGKSPNESDAIVGGFENARRHGFRLVGIITDTGGSAELLLSIAREREQKARIDRALGKHTALPSGQLRLTQPPDKSRARLNR